MSARNRIKKQATKQILNKPPAKERDVLFVEGLPAQLRHSFKGACAVRGVSMKDQLIKMMTDYVNKTPVK